MARAREYSKELLERATRLVFEFGRPIAHVARDLGVAPETLRKYERQVEANEGRRKDMLSSGEREDIRQLRGEIALARPRALTNRLGLAGPQTSASAGEYRR